MKPRNNLLLFALLGLLVFAVVRRDDPIDPAGPIIGKGLRVLIVEETAQRSSLPAPQLAELTSGTVFDYLNEKCTAEAGGKKAWRIFDKDTDVSQEAKFWQDAMGRKRDSLPWLIVSNGRKGFEGPLPANTEALLELIRKYE